MEETIAMTVRCNSALYRRTFFFLLILFCVMAGDYKTFADDKYVVIGDSYTGTNYGQIDLPWPEQLRKELGLSKKNFVISRKGGTGFATGFTFKNLLLKVPADPEVTYRIVAGGVGNDLRSDKQTIRETFIEFNRLARKRFPNAVILYTAPNWAQTRDRRVSIYEALRFYKRLCAQYGWIYMQKTSNTLHTAKGLAIGFLEDQHHPSQEGHDLIAARFAKELQEIQKSFVKAEPGQISITESIRTTYEYLKEVKIKASFENPLITIKKLYWISSDEDIAEVNQNGKVTIYAPGKCVITARSVDGSGIKLRCRLTVEEAAENDSDNPVQDRGVLYIGG